MPCISRTLAVLVLAAAFVLASPVRRDDTAFLQCLIEKTQGKLSNGEAFSTVQSFQNDVKNNEMLGKIWAGCCQKSDENESNLRTGNPFEAGDKQNGGHEHDQLAAQEQNLKAPQGQATVDHFQGDAFRPLDPKLAKLEDVKKNDDGEKANEKIGSNGEQGSVSGHGPVNGQESVDRNGSPFDGNRVSSEEDAGNGNRVKSNQLKQSPGKQVHGNDANESGSVSPGNGDGVNESGSASPNREQAEVTGNGDRVLPLDLKMNDLNAIFGGGERVEQAAKDEKPKCECK